MLCQRRRHSRWRMLLVLFVFVGLIRYGELAPRGVPESSSSSSSSSTPVVAKKKSQDIGSLSDFTWQAWLLVDSQTGSQPGADSATLLRRITPKSVFIAPALPACADGYRADTMNRCVKSVNLDENAHFSFLLQRLNAIYANQDNSAQSAAASKGEQKHSTGPLQLNIPLIPNSKSTNIELRETPSINDPITVISDEAQQLADKATQDATVTAYEVKNDTASDEEEMTLFHGNSSADSAKRSDRTKPDTVVVPVAEFIDETNDTTNFSEVVDYKIPIDLTTLLNASGMRKINTSDEGEESIATTSKEQENTTEMSPTLVLLLSPTMKPPSAAAPNLEADDSPPLPAENGNGTADRAIIQMSNLTSNITAMEIINVNTSDSSKLPHAWKTTEVPLTSADKHQDNETEDGTLRTESAKPNESHAAETEVIYDEDEDDEEYSYTTDGPDEESAEGEEILKHGEAGITIPTRNIGQLQRERYRLKQQHNETADPREAALDAQDQIVIRFNDSASNDKDEAGSNISSEVSIDGDLILETTLLDVNTERLQTTTATTTTTTRSLDASGEVAKENENENSNDSRESHDDDRRNSTPHIVSWPRDSHDSVSSAAVLHGRERVEHFTRFEKTPAEDEMNEDMLEAAPSSSETLLYDPPEEDSITITEKQTAADEEEKQPNSKKSSADGGKEDSEDLTSRNFASSIPVSSVARTSMNLSPPEDYARYRDYERLPQGYVRFPSGGANSIHSQNYKQHHSADDNLYGSTSTKSSVPLRQKPVYHLTAPSWKPDRQLDHVAAATSAQRQKQRPALLRFWSMMPLIRDPAAVVIANPSDLSQPSRTDKSIEEEARDRLRTAGLQSRFFPEEETSPQNNADKVLAQKRRRMPIHG